MTARPHTSTRPRLVALLASAMLTIGLAGAAGADGGGSGFRTERPAMLDPVARGVRIKPLITVGENAGVDDWVFDSLPDGIAFRKLGRGRVEVYVNHETSLVPFPVPPQVPLPLNDFNNAQVSRLVMSASTGGVLDGEFVIPSSANYQRFCSSFLATREHGFDRPILFTNEEATDVVNRTGIAFPATPANGSNPEQAGVVVAYDVKSGAYKTIYGMGRHNHENSVAIPGFRKLVVMSGDDTFSPPSSQLYSYIADDTDDLWNDRGDLWAFVSDDPAINDYGDLSGSASVSGRFIKVPRDVATGAGTPTTAQAALESWSNDHNVFQFIRVEDIAYDREHPNVVYFADTGEPRARRPLPTDPPAIRDSTRLVRGASGTVGPWPNGRIFRMELDRRDPTKVRSLSILVDGDRLGAAGSGAVELIHQPDNIETTDDALLIQEDPGGHNQYDLADPNGTTARIWKYDLDSGSLRVVAKVDQSLDNLAGYDQSSALARAGGWESSGIVDVSRVFGEGWFLVDVQAGSLILETETRDGVTYEREGGQLLLVRIPGT